MKNDRATKRAGFVFAMGILVYVISGLLSRASACKLLPADVHRVADHFEVSVGGDGHFLPGIEVVVERLKEATQEYELVAHSVTNGAGVASFQRLGPGRYLVSTRQPLGNQESLEVVVTNDTRKPREERLSLRWPRQEVIHTKSLRGAFVSFADVDEPSIPLEGIRVALLEGYSGRDVGTYVTEPDGNFAFGGMSPGLYFLRLTEVSPGVRRPWGRQEIIGDIAVELNPTEAVAPDSIAMKIAVSDCARLMYKVEK